MRRDQFIFFPPEDLIILYLGLYNQEYGNKKGLEVLSKIQFSNKTQEFIAKLRYEKLNPGVDGFINLVNTIPYFLFSKGETLCYGTLVAIHQWIEQSSEDAFKIRYDIIHSIVVETIFKSEKTKFHISNKITFFEKYYLLLEEVLNKSFDNISKSVHEKPEKDLSIIPGKGINKINLNDSIYKAIELFGNNYKEIKHDHYSIEYYYNEVGFSFYIKYNDALKKIFAIKIFSPSEIKCPRGIGVIDYTFMDMVKAYGDPEMTTSTAMEYWDAEYPGIHFSFKMDKTIEPFPFNKEVYLNKRIQIITIDFIK
jgi:hypothetical protein